MKPVRYTFGEMKTLDAGPSSHTNPEEGDAASPRPTRTTALLRSPRFQGHDTGGHPENPTRMAAIDAALVAAGEPANRPDIPFHLAPVQALARVHDSGYLEGLQDLTDRGGAWLDHDTMLGPDSLETARLVSGAVIAGVEAVAAAAAPRAFILGRPPGHHATPSRGMGFCLLNHVAIGAAHALTLGPERIAIVDWDVHHGNGTQDIFYETDKVLVCSVHQSPLYPGTGAASERGQGLGEGFNLNLPLPARQDDMVYESVFREAILPAVRAFGPDLILISAGFDAHRADPIGGMRLTESGFATLASLVTDLADDMCGGRVVAVLEGGYDPPALARSVIAVLDALDGVGSQQSAVTRDDGPTSRLMRSPTS